MDHFNIPKLELMQSFCYVFFSPRSSDLPSSLLTKLPRTPPHSIVLVSPSPRSFPVLPRPDPYTLLSTNTPSLLVPFPLLPPTPLNTELLRSMDLPWISPGSPLRLMDTHLRVFPCFPSLVSPSSPHPCFSVTSHHRILLLSLIPCITINFFSHWLVFTLSSSSFLLIKLHYDSFPMTHSSFLFVYKPLRTTLVFLKLFLLRCTLASSTLLPIHIGFPWMLLDYSSPRTLASVQSQLALQQVFHKNSS